jgi:BlaI family penicillinase repressor
MEIKELTKAEEQIMHLLWQLEKAFVKDILNEIPEPKPAYNTVSTLVRILETKGFVDHEVMGNWHLYFPVISKDTYKTFVTEKLMNNYYSNSVESLFSYFIKKKKIDLKTADEIMKLLEASKKK